MLLLKKYEQILLSRKKIMCIYSSSKSMNMYSCMKKVCVYALLHMHIILKIRLSVYYCSAKPRITATK